MAGLVRRGALLAAVTVAGLIGVCIVGRFAAETDMGRNAITGLLDGLDLGPVGHLHLAGLHGDPFGRFVVDRLSVRDAKGAWLEAGGVQVQWRPGDLWRRRLHILSAGVTTLSLHRSPELGPAKPSSPQDLDLVIDKAAARIELGPELAMRQGVYDLTASAALARSGDQHLVLRAVSRLHPGDFLDAQFDSRKGGAFVVTAEALEAQGGALAGSLGLAVDRPFDLHLKATGAKDQGAFEIASHVGAISPITAHGAWSGQTLNAEGQVQLAASGLLTQAARMLGPVVSFAITGKPAAGKATALTADLRSDNLSVKAKGDVDLQRQAVGPHGLTLRADVVDFTKIFGVTKMGAARLSGGIGGDLSHWVLQGAAAVEAIRDVQYTLARVSGPVVFEGKNDEVAMQLNLQGEGGAGQGLLAALLGARPTGAARITWLKRGGMLLRDLKVDGPGLKVNGDGVQNLLGGLTAKGQAVMSNLQAANAGAKGRVLATWTAGQAADEAPWRINFDARAEAFATGQADLDHLLGPAPRLSAAMTYDKDIFSVSRSELTGAAGALAAVGLIGPADTIKLDLTWHAQGPTTLGPLEISGAAKGVGKLGGTLQRPVGALSADFAVLDLPVTPLRDAHLTAGFAGDDRGLAGDVSITGTSETGPARAKAGYRFASDGVDFTGIDVNAAGVILAGAAGLHANSLSSADLTFHLATGALLDSGVAGGHIQVVDAKGGPTANLDIQVHDAVLADAPLTIRSLTLTGKGPLARLPYAVKGQGLSGDLPWRLAGSGQYIQTGTRQAVEFAGTGRLRDAAFHTLSPAKFQLEGGNLAADMKLAVGAGQAQIDWAQGAETMSLKAQLSNLAINLIDPDLVGRFDADLALGGRGADLQGNLDARLSGAGARDATTAGISGNIKAGLAAGNLNLDASLTDGRGLKAVTNLALPMQGSAAPFHLAINRQKAMHGRYSIDGELGPLWDIFFGGDASLSGRLVADGTLGGTWSDPRLIGQATLDKGRFREAQSGLKLESLSLRADLSDTAIDVRAFDATDGGRGRATGAGQVSLVRDGVSSFRLDIKSFRLIDNDLAQAEASGRVSLNRGADGRIKLAGALNIDRAQISPNPPVPSGVVPMDVVERNIPVREDDTTVASGPRQAPVALDVALNAPGGVLIKGRGLNVELSMKAHVTGTTDQPQLSGVARVVRGDYNFAGQRFQIDDRGYITLGSTPETIRLDLTATRESPSLTAVIRIQGTAARPTITLTSTPVLPKDEVLSQVLFGASAAQLSPLQAAQLASALSGLSGNGGFDIVGGLRNFAHLDRLAIGGTAATGTTFSGGKYLTNNVYLEVIGGGRQGPGAQVEWRIRRHLSIVSKVTRQGESQLSVKWRKDY